MANRFWVGGTGTWNSTSTANWSSVSGGSAGASAPTAADAVWFDANSGTGTCTTAATAAGLNGNFNTSTLTLSLGANLTFADYFVLTAGTIALNNFTLSCTVFSSSNSNARQIQFGASGAINVTGSNANIWLMGTNTNFSYTGTSCVNFTYAGATGTRGISTGVMTEAQALNFNITSGTDILNTVAGHTYRSLNFTGFAGTLTNTARTLYGDFTISTGMTLTAGTSATTFGATSGVKTITSNGNTIGFPLVFNGIGGTFQFADALTQGSTRAFTVTNGTVALKSGVTSTVGVFTTSGANLNYLQSTSTGAAATLSQASGTVNASNLAIKDITATGGAVWNALLTNNNQDNGGNTGWNFGLSPGNTVEFSPALRSFTERKHF